MTVLVADVGGTNVRFAQVSDTGPEHAVRFENDAFPTFYDALAAYQNSQPVSDLTGCCVAVAGPVTADHARLTNRDWSFDIQNLSAALGGLARVRLTNDLVALGYALPLLRTDQMMQVHVVDEIPPNDQALVVGLGTGFNACMVKGDVVFEAELGHASLPHSVFAELQSEIGERAEAFSTNEDLFSGRGFAKLYTLISGKHERGQDILAQFDAGTDADAERAAMLMARLMGLLTREMVMQYLPLRGVHFAGGAARGILGSTAIAEFLAAFSQAGRFAGQLDKVPVRLILDDAAALIGAARYARI